MGGDDVFIGRTGLMGRNCDHANVDGIRRDGVAIEKEREGDGLWGPFG